MQKTSSCPAALEGPARERPRAAPEMLEHGGLGRPEYAIEHLADTWSLRNACVLYRPSGRRRAVSAQFISKPGVVAVVHGFSEYTFGFRRVATVRAAKGLELKLLRESCTHRPTGLAAPLLQNNLYHALFHAVPAFAAFRDVNPTNVTFLPLLAAKASLLPRRGAWYRWRAWELTVRALTRQSAGQIADDVQSLLRLDSCMCFDYIRGSTAAYAPAATTLTPALRAFRDAALANARRLAGPLTLWPQPSIGDVPPFLFIRRSRTRVLSNADAFFDAVGSRIVQEAYLEALPLSRQLAVVAASSGMVWGRTATSDGDGCF